MKILAVDDEQMITKLLHNILEAKGHDIHTASNINETMKPFDSSFDLVIVDRFLSGPHNEASDDGIKLIKTLKDRSPLTQAILITGGGTHCVNDINEIIQSGINYVLYKPFTNEELTEVINKLKHNKLKTISKQCHELNQPAMVILNLTDLMNASKEYDDKKMKNLKEQANRLVNTLKEMSRIIFSK